MQDLSSIADALHGILEAPGTDGDSFTQLIQTNLESRDPGVRLLTLEILLDVVTEGPDDLLAARRKFIFGETVLTYLPLLLPLSPEAPETVETLIQVCLESCSPREAILALNEACQLLEEKAEGYDVSDEGVEEDSEEGSRSRAGDEAEPEELADQMLLILASYPVVFHRLPGIIESAPPGTASHRVPAIKTTPTLLTVSDAIASSLPSLASAFRRDQARDAVGKTCESIKAAQQWVSRCSDLGGEQRAILGQLLYMVLTSIMPSARPGLLKFWFYCQFPRYFLLTSSWPPLAYPAGVEAPDHVFDDLPRVLFSLGIDTPDLVSCISRRTPSSPHAPLACLHLLAHRIVSSSSSVVLPRLEDMMVPLSSGLSGSATDSAGTVLWEAVYRAEEGTIELDTAMPLMELLMPLVTADPDKLSRLAYYKLIQALVEKVPAGMDQILLLQQLLEPANPYDTLRPQALSILRELLARAASQHPSDVLAPSSPTAQHILQPALLSHIPLLPSAEYLALSTADFLEGPAGTFVADQLMTLRLLFELDKGDLTGVRSEEYGQKIRDGLREVERKVEEIKVDMGEGEGATAYEFVLLRIQDTAARLGDKIRR